MTEIVSRIESELEVKAYIQNLRYALNNGAKLNFQVRRVVDDRREEKYTNQYTINKLFPDEDYGAVLRRELLSLTPENYIRTVKDLHFPMKSEMREFGKTYDGYGEVYIKIRVELLGIYGESTTFVMSFHFAEYPFTDVTFPYLKK